MVDRAQPSVSDSENRWQGHLAITREVLLRILLRSAGGDEDFTRAERILYTTCEFWAAIRTRSIAAHLGAQIAENLHNASAAFSAIGANHVANSLNACHRELAAALTAEQLLEPLAALENELSVTSDPVDLLIAHYATAMKDGARVSSERPDFDAVDLPRRAARQ